MMIPLGVVIVAAIVVPWYAALYHEHGWTYIRSFLDQRERRAVHVGRRASASTAASGSTCRSSSATRSRGRSCCRAPRSPRGRRAPASRPCCGAGSPPSSASSRCRRGSRISTSFRSSSAVAALGGVTIARGLSDERWKTWVSATLAVAGALLALAGAAVLYLFETAGRVYALDAALIVGAIGLAGGVVVAVLRGRAQARGRRAVAPRRDGRRQLGVRRPRAAGVRALQAGPGIQPRAAGTPAAGGRRRALPGLAAEHGLLPAPARGPVRRRSAVREGDPVGQAGLRRAVGGRLQGARAADRRPDVRDRPAADLRGETAAGPRPAAAARAAADHATVVR